MQKTATGLSSFGIRKMIFRKIKREKKNEKTTTEKKNR
jgi:hypothetical protein